MKFRHVLMASTLVAGSLLASVAPATAAAAASDATVKAGIKTYIISVRTGNLPNADTDDAVRFGVRGDVRWAESFRVERDFRTGENVTFSPKRWEDLGTIVTATAQKSGDGDDDWYLSEITIHDEALGKTYVCAYHNWIRDSRQRQIPCS